jgi:regulator of sirC expression with transglutaminase-like and TPR domain
LKRAINKVIMTMLEKFVSFANALPSDRMESVEENLAALMQSLSDKYGFSESEQTEIDRRSAIVDPEFSSKSDITKIFGKSFSA